MADPAPAETDSGTVSSAARALLRAPRRTPTFLTLAGAVVAAAVCWYFGADGWHAVLIGAAVAAAGLAWIAVPMHARTDWRERGRDTQEGTRQDVLQLSWSVRPRYGRVREPALRRVQELARYRLALHHLDLLDPGHRPRIEQLIGRAAYSTLRPTGRRPPFLRSVVRCLDALDVLDPSRSAKENR